MSRRQKSYPPKDRFAFITSQRMFRAAVVVFLVLPVLFWVLCGVTCYMEAQVRVKHAAARRGLRDAAERVQPILGRGAAAVTSGTRTLADITRDPADSTIGLALRRDGSFAVFHMKQDTPREDEIVRTLWSDPAATTVNLTYDPTNGTDSRGIDLVIGGTVR